MKATVDPRDVAVVVQGACGPATARNLQSIRRHLPGTRLVLSTWDGTDTSGYDVDEVVLSEDPGAMVTLGPRGIPAPPVNVNRMIRSTMAGLERADRPLVVKMRTDAEVEHSAALSLLADRPVTKGEWALFRRLIVVSSVYTRDPMKSPTGSFHPADTIQLGDIEDLLTLWDVPFFPEEDTQYFGPEEERSVWSVSAARFYPEQWVFLGALRKRYVVEYEDRTVFSPEVFEASTRSVVQNFAVAEPWQLGIRVRHLEQWLRWSEDPACVMTQPIWHEYRRNALATKRDRPWGNTQVPRDRAASPMPTNPLPSNGPAPSSRATTFRKAVTL